MFSEPVGVTSAAPTMSVLADGACVASIPFDAVQTAGSYICNWNGYLMRVPREMAGAARGRAINIVGSEPLFVTKISDDPEIPVTRARQVAGNLNLRVSF